MRYIIEDTNGRYWTDQECWGVRQAAAEYTKDELPLFLDYGADYDLPLVADLVGGDGDPRHWLYCDADGGETIASVCGVREAGDPLL